MLLTTCAACAKPLGQDAPAHCVNCRTRYCGDRCLRYHAHRGGHDENCDEIASGGGAEQHHANKKYEEAAAEAVEECAEDTEGQTCYICLEDGSEEGLVRMCACRGASGIAHLSCLARQAKILVQEAEERNLNTAAFNTRWRLWDACRLCEQDYHGVVACALSDRYANDGAARRPLPAVGSACQNSDDRHRRLSHAARPTGEQR